MPLVLIVIINCIIIAVAAIMPIKGTSYHSSRRHLQTDASPNASQAEDQVVDKSFKICSVLGGLDITRFVSSNTRSFFGGAIDDVEFIREFVSEAATNGAIRGGMSDLTEMAATIDLLARGYDNDNTTNIQTTVDAGLGYVDDRIDRRIERFVSLSANSPFVGTKQTDMSIIDSVSLIFPWIIDRKSNEQSWWITHQNGRSQGPTKQPFLFESLYTAAWIGTYGEAWAYYPPIRVYGHPLGFGDILGSAYNSHEEEFVKPNLPENNPQRHSFFTTPYPDSAVPGLSLITAMAPIYYTGTFSGNVYNDTYLASTGVDIAVSSVSTLLHVLEDKLTKQSFGMLVDVSNFNTIVISQTVVSKIYPPRTGMEESRVTYDTADGSIVDDRRNQTYLVSDTILQDLTKLDNADWKGLLEEVQQLSPGERDYSTLDLTLTGNESPTMYYVIYERWEHVADWVLLVFAPTAEVDNAISVGMFNNLASTSPEIDYESFVYMEGVKGHTLRGETIIVNNGTLDVTLAAKRIPDWIHLVTTNGTNTDENNNKKEHTLRAGESLIIPFSIVTDNLDFGTSYVLLTFIVQDDRYPDCFYNQDITLPVSIKVTPTNCVEETGDTLRVWSDGAAEGGTCICAANAVEIGGNCVSYSILLPAILVPMVLIGLVAVYLYVERKRKQADSVWAVKTSELHFCDPPEIVGRGTFGLVLMAEYRGTHVAVKRVIPPRIHSHKDGDANRSQERRNSNLGKGAVESHVHGHKKFDFDNDVDIESADVHALESGERALQSGGSSGAFNGLRSGSLAVGNTIASHDSAGALGISFRKKNKRYRDEYSRLKTDFIDEMRHLSKLRHPCITTVMGAVISSKEEPMLVMEYMDHGSLFDLLQNNTMWIEGDLILPILRDIAQGLRFLHSATPQVIHGDLKAQNVLVDIKFRAKVADFGLSQKKKVGACGTPLWMAPELIRGDSGNAASSDVYSFGIILYEVYSRKVPYEGEDHRQVLRDVCDPIINKRPPVPKSMPAAMASLMPDCLVASPESRPTFDELANRLKRLDVENVEPGQIYLSKQAKKMQEGERSFNVLLDVFPRHVAEALRDGRKVEPEHHDCVSIFFSDIVGFTSISSSITVQKVSDMLDRLYLRFDALSHEHGVFKIETIGDAWMGVTNLVSEDQADDHSKRIAEFAIDAVQAAGETLIDLEDPDRGYVQIRVGFHSGPVLSNVVGSRNPKYSIFGDTVNTSARMESNSLPGCIHCSDRAAALLKIQAPDLPIAYRGEINVKGKGEMSTYWVNTEVNYTAKSYTEPLHEPAPDASTPDDGTEVDPTAGQQDPEIHVEIAAEKE